MNNMKPWEYLLVMALGGTAAMALSLNNDLLLLRFVATGATCTIIGIK